MPATESRSPSSRGTIALPMKGMVLLAFLLSPLLALRIDPNAYEGGRSKDEADIQARNSSSFAIILGEVRTNLSDLMFIKTERYLHNGVAYRPHLDMDQTAQSGEIVDKHAGHDHGHGESGSGESFDFAGEFEEHEAEAKGEHVHDEAEEESSGTIIKGPEDDFRGFIGRLEREVKPWRDPKLAHIHTSGTELLPWYRLMTLSDPKNVRAYLIGAWWLKGQRKPEFYAEALNFVSEGIENNPQAFQLYLMRGYIYNQMEKKAEAREAFTEAAELAVKARPAGWTPEDEDRAMAEALGKSTGSASTVRPGSIRRWTNYQEEDARAAARLAVIAERDAGSALKAVAMARRYVEALEGDGRLEAMIGEITNPAGARSSHGNDPERLINGGAVRDLLGLPPSAADGDRGRIQP